MPECLQFPDNESTTSKEKLMIVFCFDAESQKQISGSGLKPILTFDVNSTDQLLCAGTELVGEDCHLLFWDTRASASELLGAYWESHSDDVTSVKFHPEKSHLLCSGSTDGLLNVFNLLETTEDDALLYSFNTESSVDSITWRSSLDAEQNGNHIVALTHPYQMQVWDADSGDSVCAFKREQIASALEADDPDSVHLVACHREPGKSLKLVTSSVSGGFAKILELDGDNKLQAKGILLDETNVLQSACYLHADDRWITFDENGFVKLWSSAAPLKSSKGAQELKSKEKRATRYAPYTRGDKRK